MNGQKQINFAGGSPAAITNDLPSVVCWVSQMASSSISYFLLLRQNKVTKEKATPGEVDLVFSKAKRKKLAPRYQRKRPGIPDGLNRQIHIQLRPVQMMGLR
jgi:hypothetical protein